MNKLEKEINRFKSLFCNLCYIDIEFAIKTALEIGEDAEWVFDLIENYKKEAEVDYSEIDICELVYLEIFESARNEILKLTEFDIDEVENLGVGGNSIATRFDKTYEAVEKINDIVKDLETEELGLATQYFLKELN